MGGCCYALGFSFCSGSVPPLRLSLNAAAILARSKSLGSCRAGSGAVGRTTSLEFLWVFMSAPEYGLPQDYTLRARRNVGWITV